MPVSHRHPAAGRRCAALCTCWGPFLYTFTHSTFMLSTFIAGKAVPRRGGGGRRPRVRSSVPCYSSAADPRRWVAAAVVCGGPSRGVF